MDGFAHSKSHFKCKIMTLSCHGPEKPLNLARENYKLFSLIYHLLIIQLTFTDHFASFV